MKSRRKMILLLALPAMSLLAGAQALVNAGDSSGIVVNPTTTPPDLIYTRPTQKTKFRNYAFDTFGPYPIAGAALAAGIDQAYNTPPEWKQAPRGMASDLAPTSASRRSAQRRAMRWRKRSRKTRCTTAVSAKAYFRGCAMP